MFEFPMEYSINLRLMELPVEVKFIITEDGPLTNFLDGKPQRPEPMVQFTVYQDVNGYPARMYQTRKTSAVPLLSDLTESRAMGMLAYHAIFGNAHAEKENAGRNWTLDMCHAYLQSRDLKDLLTPRLPEHKRMNEINAGLMEMANITYNKHYHLGQFQHGNYSVWLKRSVYRAHATRDGFGINSRWTFVQQVNGVLLRDDYIREDKTSFSFNNNLSGDFVTYEQVCELFDSTVQQ